MFRKRLITKEKRKPYLSIKPEDRNQEYLSSGCALLDCTLGGGWAKDRMINLVGDASSGKTLLAIEACANFHMQYPEGLIEYDENEEAFDEQYAATVGLPVDDVNFTDPEDKTLEGMHNSLMDFCDRCKAKSVPGLFICDSIDPLSTIAELTKKIEKASYGTERAKKISEICRKAAAISAQANVTIMIVSQVRRRIGITFGETRTRGGGEALNFYSSQILWLSEKGKIKRKVRNGRVERVTGLDIRAKCRKNKAGLAHRECEFPLLFGYGLDDMVANAAFIGEVEGWPLDCTGIDSLAEKTHKRKLERLRNEGGSSYINMREFLAAKTKEVWFSIEEELLPKRGKYD